VFRVVWAAASGRPRDDNQHDEDRHRHDPEVLAREPAVRARRGRHGDGVRWRGRARTARLLCRRLVVSCVGRRVFSDCGRLGAGRGDGLYRHRLELRLFWRCAGLAGRGGHVRARRRRRTLGCGHAGSRRWGTLRRLGASRGFGASGLLRQLIQVGSRRRGRSRRLSGRGPGRRDCRLGGHGSARGSTPDRRGRRRSRTRRRSRGPGRDPGRIGGGFVRLPAVVVLVSPFGVDLFGEPRGRDAHRRWERVAAGKRDTSRDDGCGRGRSGVGLRGRRSRDSGRLGSRGVRS
jgi:hypothetical protein